MSETKHEKIIDKIFAHPTSHNIEWRELIAALKSIGSVEEVSNGKYHFTHNGRTLTFDEPGAKDVSEEEILRLRRFLNDTAKPDIGHVDKDCAIIVVTHDDVSVYRAVSDSKELKSEFKADDVHGYRRHVHHKGIERDAMPQPDEDAYYDAVADALEGSERIVLMSNGTGSSNSGERFLFEFTKRHHLIAEKIVSELTVDIEALTLPQLISVGRTELHKKSISKKRL